MLKRNFLPAIVLFFSIGTANCVTNTAMKKPEKTFEEKKAERERLKTTLKRTLTKSAIASTWGALKEHNKKNSKNGEQDFLSLFKEIDLCELGKITSELILVDELMPIEKQTKLEKYIEMLTPTIASHLIVNLAVKDKENAKVDAFLLFQKLLGKIIGSKFLTRPGDNFYQPALDMATVASFIDKSGKYNCYSGLEKISLELIKENAQNKSGKLNNKNYQKAFGKAVKTVSTPFVKHLLAKIKAKNDGKYDFVESMAPVAAIYLMHLKNNKNG